MPPKLHTIGDFHKLALSTKDKDCKSGLLAMHKQFRLRHGCSTANTPLLPNNIDIMLPKHSRALNVRDVRSHAKLFTFVQWYGHNNIVRELSKKDLGHWLDLCVHTLMHIAGLHDTSDKRGLRQCFLLYLRGQCPGWLHTKRHFCLQHALACGESQLLLRITDKVFAEVVSFIERIVGVSEREEDRAWLQTSLSFHDKAKVATLCDWSYGLAHTLFGVKTAFVLVILFKQHVEVFCSPGEQATMVLVIRSKTDDTCMMAIAKRLRDTNLITVGRSPTCLDVRLCRHHGLYMA